MESQPQNPEFRIKPENIHPCIFNRYSAKALWFKINLLILEQFDSFFRKFRFNVSFTISNMLQTFL